MRLLVPTACAAQPWDNQIAPSVFARFGGSREAATAHWGRGRWWCVSACACVVNESINLCYDLNLSSGLFFSGHMGSKTKWISRSAMSVGTMETNA